ncbi:hypothetical protein HGI47_16580 [Novosphingobium sp. ERN07]|uniref:DoxX family protein n=1 Tax=Novosphingobium sp. ERN07 TaxID=2726187 RepID=UPI0014563022|nr:DoxX family protein [Novosphingobium sp. ERN07]NLR72493.1 hypothetical protein [Novosphingobium sp. ERN07]
MSENGKFALVRQGLIVVLTLPLALFHGFVGWHKAFSSHAELVMHKAWTAHLPEALGRAVGWLELALTLAFIAALLRTRLTRMGVMACAALVVLEAISLLTHQIAKDGAPALQNVVTIVVTAFLGWLYARRAATAT